MTATNPEPGRASNAASGIFLLVAGLFVAAAGGAVMKMLADNLPATQIVWFRFLGYFLIMIPIVMVRVGRASLKPARPGWQVLRGVVLAISTTSFILGVKYLDYGDAIAILYAYPFLMIIMARGFLGEKPSMTVWLAVTGGFIGVLFVAKPDLDGINIGAAFVLVCALFVAAQLTLNRYLGSVSDPLVTSMWGACVATVILSPMAVLNWTPPDPKMWGLLLALVVMGAINQTIIVIAFAKAEAATLAPFTYVEMIAGVFFGYTLFGTLPDLSSWLGIVLIMLCGVVAARAFSQRNVPKRNPKF